MTTSALSQPLLLKGARIGSEQPQYSKMKEGEAKFLQIASLIFYIAPHAVRFMFDMKISAKNLVNAEPVLKQLLQKRIISQNQWKMLYPSTGNMSSEIMDLSLMIVLLREISKIPPPKPGWNQLPDQMDYSEGADLARIKYYRNLFVHSSNTSFSDEEFTKIWEDLCQALIRIGGQGIANEITTILNSNLNEPLRILESEKEREDITFNIMHDGKQKARLEAWKVEDETFIPTRATKVVEMSIEKNNLTLVSGPPGSGKSATVHHIALIMRQSGFKVVYVSSVENIDKYWRPDEKQLFILDDPFGKHDTDEYEVKRWLKLCEDIKAYCQYSRMKILVSVRLHIIQERKVKQVLHLYQSNIVDITKIDISLTKDEKYKIFMRYATSVTKHDFDAAKSEIQENDLPYFPLLSKLYAEKFGLNYSIKDFFHEALDIILKDIESIQLYNKCQYFCLLYCMICDNNLELYAEDFEKNYKAKIHAISKLSGVQKDMERSDIQSHLELLLGTYLKKEGNTYYFLHDFINDAVIKHASHLPLDLISIILKNCSSKFVREKLWLGSIENEDFDEYIVLGKEMESAWGERLIVDLKAGHWNDVFRNKCLETAKGDEIFAKSVSKLAVSEKEDILCSTKNIEVVDDLIDIEKLDKVLYQKIFESCSAFHWMILIGLEQAVRETSKSVGGQIKKKLNTDMNFLLLACISGNLKMAQMFIQDGHKVNAECINNLTPLLVASYYNHDHILKMLIANGASIHTYNHLHQSPLYVSAEKGHVKVVNTLLIFEDIYSENVMSSEVANAQGHHENDFTNSSDDEEKTRKFIVTKKEINESDINGKSPLYISSENGHEDVVRLLLWNLADVDQCDKDGNSPALISSDKGHFGVLEMLIKHGADVEKTNDSGMSPLHYASKNGDEKIAYLLMDSGRGINQLNFQKRSPLHLCAKEGHCAIMKMLLDNGAIVNQLDIDDMSPLYISSFYGHVSAVRMLVERGARVNQCDKNEWSSLYVSSLKGNEELVGMLLQNGANVNEKNDSLRSPLFASAYQGNVKVVKILLENGAAVNSTDRHEKSPLYIASQNGHTEVVLTLIKNGGNIHKSDSDGKSPIYIASQYGHYQMVKLLIEKGADIQSRNMEGKSPSYIASKYGHYQVLKILIEQGADINICSKYGKSPLYASSENGHLEIVKMLIENGGDVNKADNNGKSPMDVARMKRNIAVMKLLVAADKTNHNLKETGGENQEKQGHLQEKDKHYDQQIYCLLIQNFSHIVEEVDPKLLVIHLCKEDPDMNTLFTLIESIRCRKRQCVRFLLEVLVHRQEFILTVWDNIGKMYGTLKDEIKSETRPSSHFIFPRHHVCRRCSQPAFLEFLTQFPNLPDDLLIELLQNGKLKPEDFLMMNKCVLDEDKLELFKILIQSQTISYLDFVAAVLSVAQKTNRVITMMVSFLKAQLCDDLKKAYNVSEIPPIEEIDAYALSLRVPKKKIEPPQPTFIAAVKLQTNKDLEFEKKLVEAVLQRKEDINSKIQMYGKIKTAWLGSLTFLLEIISRSGKDIHLSHIYPILKKILEDKNLKQTLQEEQLDLRFNLDVAGMTNEEKDLCWKKIMIMSNIDFFKAELAIESFQIEFSKRNIIDQDEFKKKFKIASLLRQQRTQLFLDFILSSQSHVMEAFIYVLKTDENYQLLSEVFKKYNSDSLENDRTVGDLLQIPTTSNESEMACAAGCTMDEQGNVVHTGIGHAYNRVTDHYLFDQTCNSNITSLGNPAIGRHPTLQITNAKIFMLSSITENKFNTVNEICSKVAMVGEGNTSVTNFASSKSQDEGSDSNDEDDNIGS